MQLSVIIVNYNVGYFLEQCLNTVLKAVAALEAEVIVVDNHSSDKSMEWLPGKFPDVRFIAKPHNLGFAKANNIALKNCSGQYVLFLNPDTLAPENAIKDSISYMEENAVVGGLGLRMIDGYGRFLPESKRSLPTAWSSFFKLVGLAWIFPRSALFNRYGLGQTNENVTQKVEVLAGACMLVRKGLLDSLEGFDERYFMYGEDIDLSYRIRELGFENHYFAGAMILHFKGASSRKGSMVYTRNFYGAMQIFVQQHYTRGAAGIFRIFISTAIFLRAMLTFLAGRLLRKRATDVSAKLNASKTIVVGGVAAYNKIEQALPGNVLLRISAGDMIEDTICTLPDLALFNRFRRIETVIFCEGYLPMSTILYYVERLSNGKTEFLFHTAGSGSIVGANHLVQMTGVSG